MLSLKYQIRLIKMSKENGYLGKTTRLYGLLIVVFMVGLIFGSLITWSVC